MELWETVASVAYWKAEFSATIPINSNNQETTGLLMQCILADYTKTKYPEG